MKIDFVAGPDPPTYTREIVRRLQIAMDFSVLTSKGYAASPVGTAYRLLDHPVGVVLRRRDGSILHVETLLLAYLLAFPMRPPKVLTCLDIVPFLREFDDPSYANADGSLGGLRKRLMMRGLRAADRIIAISRNVRDDLVRLGCDPSAIDVVPMGVNRTVFRPLDPGLCRTALEKYGVPKEPRVVLFVGTEHPRKNVPRLFRAFRRAADGRDACLVKVGPPRRPQREQLENLAASLGVRDRIVFVDRVADEDMPYVYGSADVLVLPSLYEGFGLPPLEAMACGTAVAVSNATSLPEVVGNAGVLFDPHDEAEMAEVLGSLLDDDGNREELRARGLARAILFPWEKTVEGTLETYRRVSEPATR